MAAVPNPRLATAFSARSADAKRIAFFKAEGLGPPKN
jgi:hypothetical protein